MLYRIPERSQKYNEIILLLAEKIFFKNSPSEIFRESAGRRRKDEELQRANKALKQLNSRYQLNVLIGFSV